MKNLRLRSKRVLPLLFAGVVLASFSGCSKKNNEERQENLVGHFNVSDPDKISSSDFICYNVGNHSRIGVSNQDKLIKKCDENDISVGIVIDCDYNSRLDIFEDIEFVKSIIEDNNIELPVYLSVDKLMNDNNLSMSDKASLISTFLNLVRENNIYVGLYGTSTNLSILNQYGFPISEKYDCFVVEDGKTKYTGLSSIRQDLDGNIKSTYQSDEFNDDLAKYIESLDCNDASFLKQNGYYVVPDDTDVEQIAIKYDLSVNELLKFNGLSKSGVIPGTVLRIPNQIQNKTELVFPNLKREERAIYRGIDISCYQEVNPNVGFKKISNYIDFAILKIGEQANKDFKELREDPKFDYFYKSCVENDISVGGYYVTRATTVNEAIEEANLIVNRVKDLKITFPIFIDYENTLGTDYSDEFNKIKQNGGFGQIIESVSSIFDEAGLRFGIYTNISTYSEMVDMVGLDNLQKYEIWLSKPNGYTDICQVIDNGPICSTDSGKYSFGCDINQVSWTINNLGIKNAEGYVDFNLCYKDYKAPKQMVELPPEHTFETKHYSRRDAGKVVDTCGTIAGGFVGACALLYVIGHRKIYKKKIKRMLISRSKKKKNKVVTKKMVRPVTVKYS